MITSRSNPAVKRIRTLRGRKERGETGLFFVEGIRLVAEAAALEADVETCVVAPELLTSDFAAEVVRQLGMRTQVLEVSPDVFRGISTKEGPQGIGAVVRQRWWDLDDVDPSEGLCWIALDSVADPGNLGTILRTADAVGAAGVILLGQATDPHDPTAVRASMGAVFSQRLVRASLDEVLRWARAGGAAVVGTSHAAQSDYAGASYPESLVLLMGSEREGLSPQVRALCDLVVRIPMVGRSDSLNLAVATGVVLYEVFNQRRRGNGHRSELR